jgi:hypothetical protein
MLIGSSAVVTLVACSTSALWGSVSGTLQALDCADPSSLPRPNNSTSLQCNGYSSAISAITVLSSLIFLTQAAITGMVYMWQADFVGFESNPEIYESITTSSPRSSSNRRYHQIPVTNDEESLAASMPTSVS